jgi:RHS repeat-associated protein
MVYTKSPLRDFPCPLSNGYDALGRRVITVSGGVTNFHVYDGLNILADTDATGGVLRVYGHGAGIDHLLTMTVYTSGTAKIYYYLTDQLGSVHALADEVGNIIESYRFDAWGKVVGIYDGNGNHLSESAYGNRFLWQGREYSYRTGLYYFRARWYDPVMGRWLINDPIGLSGGLNQYVFCGNNHEQKTRPAAFDFTTYPDPVRNELEKQLLPENDSIH